MKELAFSIISCVFGLMIYLDFLNKFRGKDVYFVKMKNYTKPGNLTGMWKTCNDDNNICYGNGLYSFDVLQIRPFEDLDRYSN
jgi:hypothetical protein